jgi:RNA polymerase sigma-70 factor (ECF subfamily)
MLFKIYKNLSDIQLINLIKQNDYNAMEELVKRKQDKIFMTFFYLYPNCNDLHDLTQEALLKMCKNVKNLKNPIYFNSWLNKIISNIFYDKLRKNKKSPYMISVDDSSHSECNRNILDICDPCPCPAQKTLNRESLKIIHENILKLPQKFRLVIVLREIAGLSYDEISKATGLELGTVKSRINRARNQLKIWLNPYFKNN